MYVYYFNHKDGHKTLDVVTILKVTKTEETMRRGWFLYKVWFEPNEQIKAKWLLVPQEEGVIYERRFWLSDYNIVKSERIINDYLKTRFLEAQSKYERLLNK